MSAYKIALSIRCVFSGCTARATCEVFNTFNSCVGRFCTKHADQRIKDLRRSEVSAVKAVVADRSKP